MAQFGRQKAIKGFELTIILEPQPEGGFTITCRELPELITECDSLSEMRPNVIDAFQAVLGLYAHKKRPLPIEIQRFDNSIDVNVEGQQQLETVVAFNEVSGSVQKVKTT